MGREMCAFSDRRLASSFMLSRLSRRVLSTTTSHCSRYSTSTPNTTTTTNFDADELGLPKNPTWSVNDLLNSYPPAELADETLSHLHNAAALLPPERDTEDFQKIKRDMANLIKLVEAVRIAPVSPTSTSSHDSSEKQPDGRIWPEGRSIDLRDYTTYEVDKQSSSTPPEGRELMNRAYKSQDGYYLVQSPKLVKD